MKATTKGKLDFVFTRAMIRAGVARKHFSVVRKFIGLDGKATGSYTDLTTAEKRSVVKMCFYIMNATIGHRR